MRSNQLASATGNPSDTTGDMATQAIPTRPADGAPLPPIYQLRMDKERDAAVRAGGGSMLTEGAVESALSWLAQNQSASGGLGRQPVWQRSRDTCVGAGSWRCWLRRRYGCVRISTACVSRRRPHTLRRRAPRNSSKRLGVHFCGRETMADFGGNARTFARMYCHSIALFAVCEAYAMTGDERIQTHAQRAVSYSVAGSKPPRWRLALSAR